MSKIRKPRIIAYVADPTSRKNVGPACGFGVWCEDLAVHDLIVIEDYKRPYETKEKAEEIRDLIDEIGHCAHIHRIVQVYPVYAGAVPKERANA